MEKLDFGTILNCVTLLFVTIIGIIMLVFNIITKRDRVPRFRRKLMRTLNESGIKNEIKDEVLYLSKRGQNMCCQFWNGNDGAIDVLIESVYKIDDFNIDGFGEYVIERRINTNIGVGKKLRFIGRKEIALSSFTSIRKTESLTREMDWFVDCVNNVFKELYDNKNYLEETFGEKPEQEQNTRKIGF